MTSRGGPIGHTQREILEELTAGDILYGFLLSARSTKRMYKHAHERAAARHRRKKALENLVDRGYIRQHNERLSITTRGRNKLAEAAGSLSARHAKTVWDGKWRVAAFDIPEKYAPLRRTVRTILKRAGFVLLQQSIWVYPHECAELVHLIRTETSLSGYILYGVLAYIEDDTRLRRHFRLK